MEKLTIISHIFNEEYLLPFWLEHHSKIFGHGIIIDYFSTDNSVNIIKKYCPTWEVVKTVNVNNDGSPNFEAILVDKEVIEIEKRIDGYKICLNTTEFLLFEQFSVKEFVGSLNKNTYYSISAFSILSEKSFNPKNTIEFFEGIELIKNVSHYRGHRALHSEPSCPYNTGRHNIILKDEINIYVKNAVILWTGYYPFNEEFIKRKLQIQQNIPETDKIRRLGFQHITNRYMLQYEYINELVLHKKISDPEFENIIRMINNFKNMDILNNSLITGGSGMVGNNIKFGLKPSSLDLDITNNKSIELYVSKHKISCIIHLAATNLRESEQNCNKTINTTINGTTNMLKIAMKLNIPFILLSSGAVFSSKNPNIKFDEKFETCPNSIYGQAKNASEQIALLYGKTILIRTGWLFGGNQKNHYKFVESVINNIKTNTNIYASNDFFGSPTYVIDLIEQMKYLIINLKYGIHHVVNSGFSNGHDTAIEISKIMNNAGHKIFSVKSSDVPNPGPARSKTEILESINSFNHLRDWKEALKEYINKEEEIIIKQPIIKKWSNRNKCRLCNSYDLEIFYKLEPTPPANHFISEITPQDVIPLDVCICKSCKHVQLVQIVDPVFQYSNYLYVSSTSNTMVQHLKDSVTSFTCDLPKTSNILEIGANDGVCIKHLLDTGFVNVVGVDPADNINKRHDLPIICDFFGSGVLDKLKENKFKLIYAFHCCAHIENIQDVFETINKLLDHDGVFIMEVGYFYTIFKNKLFDIIYHEHIDYHTTYAIQQFSNKYNLILYKTHENDIQGGSIQFFFSKNKNILVDNSVNLCLEKEKNELYLDNLIDWKKHIINTGKDVNYILNSLISYGKTIVGYGAPAKLTTFLYEYKLSNYIIKYIIDDNIHKQYLYSPGLHIPIKPFEYLSIDRPDYIIILSWNFKNEIIKKLEEYRKIGIRIIVPFPEIMII